MLSEILIGKRGELTAYVALEVAGEANVNFCRAITNQVTTLLTIVAANFILLTIAIARFMPNIVTAITTLFSFLTIARQMTYAVAFVALLA
jgi:hypothetical protein